ncbi:unnamed protein product [Closterium sp. Naga37s-1]|nr:unnamed protein product [Closterium sp. Naga37s-1]
MSSLLVQHPAVAASATLASASRREDGASSAPFAPLPGRKSVTSATFTGGRSQLSSSALRLESSTSAATASTRNVSVAASSSSSSSSEEVFFDSGPHVGDLALNLVLGFTGVWLPLTLASAFRVLTLRYRFTNRRFTVLSEIDEKERLEYPYSLVSEVRSAPRFIGEEWGGISIILKEKNLVSEVRSAAGFIGEWGDISIILKDKTLVSEVRSVPRFIGEWGDISIILKDKSVIDLRSVWPCQLITPPSPLPPSCMQLVSEVRSVPRFIGEWGDISIILKDKSVIDLRSVPKFREVAKYVEERASAAAAREAKSAAAKSSNKGFDPSA